MCFIQRFAHQESKSESLERFVQDLAGCTFLDRRSAAYAQRMRFSGLKRAPVRLSGSWASRRYLTRVTGKDEEFFVWYYEFTFTAQDPLRAVYLVSQGDTTRWERSHGSTYGTVSAPERTLRVPLTFRPLDPVFTAEMHVSLGYVQVRITSEALKDDPREVIQPPENEELLTGEVSDLAAIPGDPSARARILLLDAGDTEDARLHKWRMRSGIRKAAPPEFPFLASGYQTGDIATSFIEDKPAS